MSTVTIVTALIALAVGLVVGGFWGAWKPTGRLVDMTLEAHEKDTEITRLRRENWALRGDVNRMLKHQLEL